MKKYIAIGLLVAFPAWGQQVYVAPDEDTWGQMVKALENIPMSMDAHIQVNNILSQVRQIASQKKIQTDAPKPVEPKK